MHIITEECQDQYRTNPYTYCYSLPLAAERNGCVLLLQHHAAHIMRSCLDAHAMKLLMRQCTTLRKRRGILQPDATQHAPWPFAAKDPASRCLGHWCTLTEHPNSLHAWRHIVVRPITLFCATKCSVPIRQTVAASQLHAMHMCSQFAPSIPQGGRLHGTKGLTYT